MSKKSNKSINDKVLDSLLEDPTRSIGEIAKELGVYRQGVWRKKKALEENKTIWGYTAVIDESKLNHIIYLIMMKSKPMSRGLADLLVDRLRKNAAKELNVRLLDLFYVNGEYDWILRFSSPSHSTARRYYDTLRVIYEEYLLEKPVMVDVNFCLVAEGKPNPEMDELYNFTAK